MTTIDTPVSAPPRPTRVLTPREWGALATTGVFALAPLPLLTIHAQQLNLRPHYQLCPLVLPGAIALGWHLLRQPVPPGPVSGRNPRRTSLIALFALILLAVAVLFISPWLAAIAAIFNVLAIIDAVGGGLLIWRLLPAWGFLWLAIPPPRGPDEKLLQLLQGLATEWSSAVLDRLGVVHLIEGNVIEVVGRRLFVEQACSGINSLFTLVLGTLFLAAWGRFRLIRTCVLVMASFVWVLAGNVARIVVIAFADARWHIDLSEGMPHTILGMILFVGMLGLVFSTDRLVEITLLILKQEVATILAYPIRRWNWLFRRKDARPTGTLAPASGLPIKAEPISFRESLHGLRATRLGAWPFAVVSGLLVAAQMGYLWHNKRDILRSENSIQTAFDGMTEGDLPRQVGNFRRVGFRTDHREHTDLWGENSRAWLYQSSRVVANVSVDYTFLGWHKLTDCYVSNGCKGFADLKDVYGTTSTPGWTEVGFTDVDGRYRYLIYGLADYDSRPLSPPQSLGFVESMLARLGNWTSADNGLGIEVDLPTYQYQVVINSDSPIRPEEKEEARMLFQEARTAFLARGPKRRRSES